MRYKAGHKEETFEKMVSATGENFRENGFAGSGVDGLSKAAGVTSGAFYKHFGSKLAAFEVAVEKGLDELADGMLTFQHEYKEQWWQAFVKFYLEEKSTCDGKQTCALQSLSPEVARAGPSVKKTFDQGFSNVLDTMQRSSASPPQEKALADLAMLVGAVTLARASSNNAIKEQIISSVKQQIIDAE